MLLVSEMMTSSLCVYTQGNGCVCVEAAATQIYRLACCFKRDRLSVQAPRRHSCLMVSNPPVYQLLAVVAVHHAKLAEGLGAAVVVVRIPQVLPCCCQVLLALCVDEKHFEHLPGAYTLLDLHHSTSTSPVSNSSYDAAGCLCGLCVALTSSWYTKEVPGATRPSSSCILGLLLLLLWCLSPATAAAVVASTTSYETARPWQTGGQQRKQPSLAAASYQAGCSCKKTRSSRLAEDRRAGAQAGYVCVTANGCWDCQFAANKKSLMHLATISKLQQLWLNPGSTILTLRCKKLGLLDPSTLPGSRCIGCKERGH